jgi:signal peptidase I
MTNRDKNHIPVRRVLRWLVRQTERVLAGMGLAALVYWTCFDYSFIVSESMKPTLRGTDGLDGDRVLTERVSYWFRQPRRWEVVTIRLPDGSEIMKRVVALPGEKMQMLIGGKILINGREIERPPSLQFLKYLAVGNIQGRQAVDCGQGYYVLGDNSLDSDDSRFNGPVPPEQIIGRAWLVLWPSDHRGWINP